MGKIEREFSSGGVIIKKYGPKIRILLIKDPYGIWTWPKGNIDKGETSIEAAKREIMEETGLNNVELVSKIGGINFFYRRKKLIYKTVYLFLFEFVGKEALAVQEQEIDDARWFSEEGALSKVGYKGAREILKKAIGKFKKRRINPRPACGRK